MPDHRRSARRATVAGAVVLGALTLAACGSDGSNDTATAADTSEPTAAATAARTVDDAKVEAGIKADLSTSSTQVTSAKCPNDVAVKQGGTFTCSVKFSNGASGKAKVTQLGGGRYSYELKPGSVQVPGTTADKAVEKSLAAQGIPNATVNCPQNIIVKVGTTVTCNVSGAQGAASGTVTFTFSSAEGTVDQSSVETS
jgi:Domain of unknown function (DUF4333)